MAVNHQRLPVRPCTSRGTCKHTIGIINLKATICLQVPHVRVLDKFGFPAFPEREGGEDGPPKKTFTMRIDFSNGQSLVWRWG